MIDPKLLREQPEMVKNSLKRRGISQDLVSDFLKIDNEWRQLTTEADNLRAEQKKLSQLRKIDEAKKIKKQIQEKEKKLFVLQDDRQKILEKFPNIPLSIVPDGKDENDNKLIREVGKKPVFDFIPQDYLKLAEKKDIIDVKRAAEVAGSRFGYFKGEAALLELALVQYAVSELVKNNFIPVIPPVMIKPEVYKKMGRLAAGQEDERYYLPKDELYLVGSAEHTLGPLHLNDILEESQLPRRYVGFSSCFRREAGSYGKDTKGILRVHQFDKVEMYSFTRPEDSEKELQFLLSMQEKLMRGLKLPYRVVEVCTGDLGWTDAHQFDIETWLVGENRYRETHSASNTTDFQTRGINARFRSQAGEVKLLHALNATGLAIGRTIIAIIENFQKKNGDVKIPSVLLKQGCFIKNTARGKK